jgi:hypothetical protein
VRQKTTTVRRAGATFIVPTMHSSDELRPCTFGFQESDAAFEWLDGAFEEREEHHAHFDLRAVRSHSAGHLHFTALLPEMQLA